MTRSADAWSDRGFLRDVQYRTDVNLAARQSIYSYQHPRLDLQARVLDLAAPAAGETVVDVGCGNGLYLAELARRGPAGRVLGMDMSPGMLTAARERLRSGGTPVQFGGSGSGRAAGSAVVLLAADATALPLRDGTAGLTLAMHMLYHVPDPSTALGELRRVTRPGGRVVIGLNGLDHLRELRDLIDAVRGEGRRGPHDRLTLDDGEALARSYFSAVTRHDFVAELRLPDQQPIADYLRSMPNTQAAGDPGKHVAAALSMLPTAPGAIFTVTTHAGCLICEV